MIILGVATAFAPGRVATPRAAVLRQAASSAAERQRILITGNNIEISDALKERVGEDIGKVIARHAAAVRQVDVTLEVGKSDRQRAVGDNQKCEATLYFADASAGVKGERVHVSESADSMYVAVDQASKVLSRSLRKLKERAISGRSDKTAVADVAAMQEDVDLDMVDIEIGCAEGDVECEATMFAQEEKKTLP